MSVILIDSLFRIGRNYCPQVFLEEYKHAVEEKKITENIIYDLESSYDVNISDKKNSYEEVLIDKDKENSDEDISDEKN